MEDEFSTLVTQEEFDAALVKILGEEVARVTPNRTTRQRIAIDMIFMDELEKGELAPECAVIRAGARTLQDLGQYRWRRVQAEA